MRNATRSVFWVRRQHGVAAVELALIMPILLLLVAVPLIATIYMWHYSAAQKAAQNAARYISTISVQEMRAGNLALAAEAITLQLVQIQIAELWLFEFSLFRCWCGPPPPMVSVTVRMALFDQIFTMVDTGRYGLPINVEVEVPYVGN
jgi:hypothetical protein